MSAIKCVKIEQNNEINKLFYEKTACPIQPEFSEFGEEKTVLCSIYKNFTDQIENFEVRDDDVFVITYPKSGTTWCQEMVWMICNNFDFEAGKVLLFFRFPHLGLSGEYDFNGKINGYGFPDYMKTNYVDYIEKMKSPRFIKSHLPWNLLPKQIKDGTKKPKIVYVTRNAKDVCVSYYYHTLKSHFKGDFNDFAKLFLAGKVLYGSIWDNIRGYWDKRTEPNILILTFEEMKKDLPAAIRKTAKFLDKTLTEDQVNILTQHLSFETMKTNDSVNFKMSEEEARMFADTSVQHIRSGTVNGYKTHMSPELIEEFDKWTRENVEKIGLPTEIFFK